MKASVIGLFAEKSLHPGTESSAGVIDLPVAREVATGYPVIVGSSLKGALKDNARLNWSMDEEGINKIFGVQDNAGAIAVTDARILLLPVRSLTGHYKWVTCPYLLERFQRDLNMAGIECTLSFAKPEQGTAITKEQDKLFLEELSFNAVDKDLSEVAVYISKIIKHQSCCDRLLQQLVVLSDDDFAHFAAYGLQVNARNRLNEATKTSENLWYEETIPADSLFYALIICRPGEEESLNELKQLFTELPYLQVGGNETIGQGWCAVTWLEQGGIISE
ncbi:type III-B CRISPR module RAMP protein Cmr4 [Peptococcaceae bacterium 1198_IL3148]